ncbi:39S ribosomal protein L52, mitochondrial-like [Orbicella faveolata]|uniref:39S ribosomal protein L52, mitochondrial-like n=1 Tax=Orbicella faveolata TaxID=48498 RepID=UPI0009E37B0A|nr:39S ribosomal protein L52, mitochondrial-like [Orbicella faveolata]XP_020609553.1 39S ribosomal protein L52, mitochondrial-like [Orbicella faveolata]
MASSGLCRLSSTVLARPVNCVRYWNNVPALQAGQKTRIRRGQARDGIAYGPLTDLPDWSFADGTPAPETRRRRIRRYKKMDVAHQILTYLNEMDRAEHARDEEGNVIDPTMLPDKHQESSNISTTTTTAKQHQEPTSIE